MASSLSYPPGPRTSVPIINLFRFRREPVNFLMSLARDYGDVAYFRIGPQDLYLLNHPDYIRDVLVTHSRNFKKSRGLEMAKRFLGEGLLTAEGEFHLRQRRLVQPAFHRQRVMSYGRVMTDYAARLRDGWQEGAIIDVWQEMMRVTLAIAGKTLFDADVESEAPELREALTDLMRLFNRVTLPFAGLLEKLPLPSNYRFLKARARLDSTIYRIINERRASGEDRGDLLSMLLNAQDDEGDGSRMSDTQVRDEAMTLFIAGHETTANALTWTWRLLSQNPDAEAMLHREIGEVLGGELPGVEHLARLRYTEMVFAEAMRLYPPAWTIGRRAINDYEVGGYSVPAGSIVLMSQYVTHHDPRFFPDPFKFVPERWTPEAQAMRPKFSYFPFGGGPRVCIGESFAWMEGVLLIAAIAQRWRLRLSPDHPVEIEPLVTLRPKHGMKMRVLDAEC